MRTMARMARSKRRLTIYIGLLNIVFGLWDALLFPAVILAVNSLFAKGSGREITGFQKQIWDFAESLGFEPAMMPIISILGALSLMALKDFLKIGLFSADLHLRKELNIDLRTQVIRRVIEAKQSYLERFASGDLVRLVLNESESVSKIYTISLTIFGQLVNILLMVAMLFGVSASLTLLVSCTLVTIGLIKLFYSRLIRRVSDRALTQRKTLWKNVDEYCRGVKHIKLAGIATRLLKQFRVTNYAVEKLANWQELTERSESSLINILAILMLATIFVAGHKGIIIGEKLPFATIFSFIVMIQHTLPMIIQFAKNVTLFIQGTPSVDQVHGFLNTPPDYIEDQTGIEKDPLIEKAMELKSVSLDYETRPGILQDVNMVIRKGEKVGIVGRSGSGKSSLVSLFLKLYEPTRGEILIDDTPINEISTNWIRKKTGLVTQDIHLFSLKIHQIISLASEREDMELIQKAARLAHAHDFIMTTPEQYNTTVGDLISKLSGGEQQRLVLSQIIMKDPEIIILDEATSSLDTESEHGIIKNIEEFSKGKTLIMIAHRLSTLKGVDRIYVLDKGRVVEQGTWKELLNSKGVFSSMVKLQEFEQD